MSRCMNCTSSGWKFREILHRVERYRIFNNGENTFAWNGIRKNLNSETLGIIPEMRDSGRPARALC